MTNATPGAKKYVIFLSEEMGVAVAPDFGYAFAIPDNRFFRKCRAAKDSFGQMIMHNAIPHDVAMYIQEQHLLPEACIFASQGKDVGLNIVQDYIAFWIGFYCELPAYGTAPQFRNPNSSDSPRHRRAEFRFRSKYSLPLTELRNKFRECFWSRERALARGCCRSLSAFLLRHFPIQDEHIFNLLTKRERIVNMMRPPFLPHIHRQFIPLMHAVN